MISLICAYIYIFKLYFFSIIDWKLFKICGQNRQNILYNLKIYIYIHTSNKKNISMIYIYKLLIFINRVMDQIYVYLSLIKELFYIEQRKNLD